MKRKSKIENYFLLVEEIEQYEFSDDFKKAMNKIFKEAGCEKIPHPEVEEKEKP